MKCPKCGYLGFETVERCRNCGYDFSLTPPADVDLSLRTEPASNRLVDDFSLAPDPESSAPLASSAPTDLPLFGSAADDEPLIKRPSPPRAPLAVRRATPEVPRARVEPARRDTLEFDVDASGPPLTAVDSTRSDVNVWAGRRESARAVTAGMFARLVAVFIDLTVLLTIDVIVVYFTMQLCGLTLGEIDILPKAPLLAFLLVQNGGYLIAFTAGGQTLGKMATGIKVVSAGSESPLDLGRSAIRTLVWVVLAVPAGLGFLTALVSRERRGLHDRFAGSRVIRASA